MMREVAESMNTCAWFTAMRKPGEIERLIDRLGERFMVCRQDSCGNKFLIRSNLSEKGAQEMIEALEAKQTTAHKQEYFSIPYQVGKRNEVTKSQDILP